MLYKMVDRGFSAAVYTQTTDVEVEVNGLMTYDRKVIKLDEKRAKEINTRICNSLKKVIFREGGGYEPNDYKAFFFICAY